MTEELRGRLLNALRSVAINPRGLRLGAFPTSMARLVEMGLVEERATSRVERRSKRAWFITEKGRAAMREHGIDET